jgi:hypothetical protein
MLIGDISSSNVNVVDENSTKTMSTFSRFVVDMHSSKYEKLKTFESIENLISVKISTFSFEETPFRMTHQRTSEGSFPS